MRCKALIITERRELNQEITDSLQVTALETDYAETYA